MHLYIYHQNTKFFPNLYSTTSTYAFTSKTSIAERFSVEVNVSSRRFAKKKNNNVVLVTKLFSSFFLVNTSLFNLTCFSCILKNSSTVCYIPEHAPNHELLQTNTSCIATVSKAIVTNTKFINGTFLKKQHLNVK